MPIKAALVFFTRLCVVKVNRKRVLLSQSQHTLPEVLADSVRCVRAQAGDNATCGKLIVKNFDCVDPFFLKYWWSDGRNSNKL